MNVRAWGRRCGLLLAFGAVLWLVTFLAVWVVSEAWSDRDASDARADAIFCLGAGMAEVDQPWPGPASERRALSCAALHQAGVADVVVFTGRGNRASSAAQAMANAAISAGLPREAALVEHDARSTIQNAGFGLAMLPEETNAVVVVSDPFHLPRSWAIFRVLGVADVRVHAAAALPTEAETEAEPRYISRPEWRIREASAIWLNIFRGVAYAAGGAVGIDRDTRIAWFN